MKVQLGYGFVSALRPMVLRMEAFALCRTYCNPFLLVDAHCGPDARNEFEVALAFPRLWSWWVVGAVKAWPLCNSRSKVVPLFLGWQPGLPASARDILTDSVGGRTIWGRVLPTAGQNRQLPGRHNMADIIQRILVLLS
jgi:hypothetical protein